MTSDHNRKFKKVAVQSVVVVGGTHPVICNKQEEVRSLSESETVGSGLFQSGSVGPAVFQCGSAGPGLWGVVQVLYGNRGQRGR